jgi:hypothetical protein
MVLVSTLQSTEETWIARSLRLSVISYQLSAKDCKLIADSCTAPA